MTSDDFGFGSRRAQAETRAVSDHVTQAVTPALNRIAGAATNGTLTTAEADRIAAEAAAALQNGEQAVAGRIAAAVTDATGEEPRPGLWARIWAFIKRIARKVAEWVRSVARKAAEKWRDRDRERLSRIGKGLARRIKSWPEAVGLRSLVADAVSGRGGRRGQRRSRRPPGRGDARAGPLRADCPPRHRLAPYEHGGPRGRPSAGSLRRHAVDGRPCRRRRTGRERDAAPGHAAGRG
ncbi:hypothetical protein [Actinacidiphila sp. bgisy160]|uniref:hypothetical protein n=1 Tax=Actinacidiphila sp. bgisy160 TaxID=3413796 RepID=UPI003D757F88